MSLLWQLTRVTMNNFCLQRNLCTGSAPLVPIQLPSRLETHLWYTVPDEVKSDALLSQYSAILSEYERDSISGMRGDHVWKGSLLARVLVRTTIARYQINGLNKPECLKFRKNKHGKPELEWDNDNNWSSPPIHFNISHTPSLIACGVTLNAPIGVDIEDKQRNPKHNILKLAERFFSPLEKETLSLISDPELQRQQFLKLWTLKEAYVKALGKGFSAMPFKDFTFRSKRNSDTEDEIIVEGNSENNSSEWHFRLVELEGGTHYSAICVGEDHQTAKGATTLSGNDDDSTPPKRLLTVRKTIPFVGDELVSGISKSSIILP